MYGCILRRPKFRGYKITTICLCAILIVNISLGQKSSTSQSQSASVLTRKLNNLAKLDFKSYAEEYTKLEDQLLRPGNEGLLYDLYYLHSNQLLKRGSYDSCLVILHQARNLQLDEPEEFMIPVYLKLSSVFHYKSNLDSLSYWQEKVAELIDKNSPHYANFLMNEGLKSQLDGDYNKSINVIIEAAQTFEKTGQQENLALAYNNLAFNYLKGGDQDAYIDYLLKSAAINKRTGNSYNLAMNYNNLGGSFREKDLLNEAIAYYDSAYHLLTTLDSPLLLAQNHMNRGNIYKRKGDTKRAIQFYLQSLAICEEHGIGYGKIMNLINLGNTYMDAGQLELSAKYLEEALQLALETQAKREEALIYERFSWLYRDMGDYKNAYLWQSKYYSLNDSLVNESVKKEAASLREIYEAEKKENEILDLSKEKLYHRFVIAAMLVVLLILLVLIVWWRGRLQKAVKEREKEELKRKYLKEVVENKDKELTALAAQLIQMQQFLDTANDHVTKIIDGSSLDPSKAFKIKDILNRYAVLEVKKNFDIRITESNRDFFKMLLERHPDLSPSELKLCAYLRLSLSNKEIAEILNVSIRTVETNRFSIRKKMGLNNIDNLVTYLLSLEMTP